MTGLSVSLSHRFAGFTLDVAFDVPPGVTALFGRSGSGKTTVVNAVAGLLRPDRGRIVAGGTVMLDTASRTFLPPHRRRVGYVFQDARLFAHLTVRQNLLYGRWFAPRQQGRPQDAGFDRIVALLDIGPLLDRRPGTLSGGEKQRVAIGRAILSHPHLLLLDEPLAALDDARKAEILPYLERLRDDSRLPILYVSHAMSEVARLATSVILLHEGRVTVAGPATRVLSDPAAAMGFGLREMGAILTARVAAQEDDDLTRLDSSAGPLWLPRIAASPGDQLRLRILAQDVMLATVRPSGLSALNILPASVLDLHMDEGRGGGRGDGAGTIVRLQAGQDILLARITRRSATALGLAPGTPVFAVLKAVAVAQENVGSPAQDIGGPAL